MADRIRSQPCEACPYRRDVASGVWAASEYDKLPPYDALTWEQPFEGFACHATPEFYCHGWAVVHTSRGHDHDLLALRVAHYEGEIPEPPVPLFESGAEAAAHGKRQIKRPSKRARSTVQKLQARYPRLKEN